MRKKVVSLVLALSLCLGLSVSASAAEMTVEEAIKPISLNAVDKDGKEFNPGAQPNELWLGNYDMGAGVLKLEQSKACVFAPADIRYTVTHEGKKTGSLIQIRTVKYEATAKSEAAKLIEDERSDDLSVVKGDVIYVGETFFGGDHLGKGGVWKDGSTVSEDDLCVLKDGESVTFQLPAAKNGEYYRLYADIYYPTKDGSYTQYWAYYDIMVGTKPAEKPAEKPQSFTDVSPKAYYADAVKWAVEKKITTGTTATTFSPNRTCTTAQILTFLWRANGAPEPTASNAYTNLNGSEYYYKAALWAAEKGIYSGKSFNGSAPATRAATVTYLWKLAGKPDGDHSVFADVDEKAEYAKAVAWAVKEGITGGTSSTTFSPDKTCTRGQIVTFLYRDLVEKDA